jgi:hypothetical protein
MSCYFGVTLAEQQAARCAKCCVLCRVLTFLVVCPPVESPLQR